MDLKTLPFTAHLEKEGFCKHLAGNGFHSDNCHSERNKITLSVKAHPKYCASLDSSSFLGFSACFGSLFSSLFGMGVSTKMFIFTVLVLVNQG